MKRLLKSVFTMSLALSAMGAVAVQAATVAPQGGSVLVSQGGGFSPITSSVQVAPGAQVMVKPGGSAVISYSPACQVTVGPGRVWSIQDKAPCAAGNNRIDMTGRMGNGHSHESSNGLVSCETAAAAGLSCATANVLVGGAILGGAGAGIYFATRKDKNKSSAAPASP